MILGTLSRRDFLLLSSLGYAGLAFNGALAKQASSSTDSASSQAFLPGGILPIALMEDACLLAFRAGFIKSERAQAALLSAFRSRPDAERNPPYYPASKGRLLSSLAPEDPRFFALLDVLRDNGEQSLFIEKLALCYGWVCQKSLHDKLRTHLRAETAVQLEIQLYHDACALRHLTVQGQSVDARELEKLLHTIQPRTLVRFHTLASPEYDLDWIHRISEFRRQQTRYLRRLAETIVAPDPEKHARYVTDIRLFDAKDTLVSYAYRLHNGQDVTAEAISKVLKNLKNTSLYTQALADAVVGISAAAAYVEGLIDRRDLKIP